MCIIVNFRQKFYPGNNSIQDDLIETRLVLKIKIEFSLHFKDVIVLLSTSYSIEFYQLFNMIFNHFSFRTEEPIESRQQTSIELRIFNM